MRHRVTGFGHPIRAPGDRSKLLSQLAWRPTRYLAVLPPLPACQQCIHLLAERLPCAPRAMLKRRGAEEGNVGRRRGATHIHNQRPYSTCHTAASICSVVRIHKGDSSSGGPPSIRRCFKDIETCVPAAGGVSGRGGGGGARRGGAGFSPPPLSSACPAPSRVWLVGVGGHIQCRAVYSQLRGCPALPCLQPYRAALPTALRRCHALVRSYPTAAQYRTIQIHTAL